MQRPQKGLHTDTIASNTDGSQDVRDSHISQTHADTHAHRKELRPRPKKMPPSSPWPAPPSATDPLKHLDCQRNALPHSNWGFSQLPYANLEWGAAFLSPSVSGLGHRKESPFPCSRVFWPVIVQARPLSSRRSHSPGDHIRAMQSSSLSQTSQGSAGPSIGREVSPLSQTPEY